VEQASAQVRNFGGGEWLDAVNGEFDEVTDED
jgi:hypothetical protein